LIEDELQEFGEGPQGFVFVSTSAAALFEILSRSRMQTTRDLSPCSFTSARQSLTTRPAKKRD
jgi:hypothetical protein